MGRKPALLKAKETLKLLFLTKEGWFSWIIANVITALPWAIPFAYGFLFNSERAYIVSGSIFAFMILPITPFWILNIVIAVFFVEKVFKKKIN
jgi:hypothetical protein